VLTPARLALLQAGKAFNVGSDGETRDVTESKIFSITHTCSADEACRQHESCAPASTKSSTASPLPSPAAKKKGGQEPRQLAFVASSKKNFASSPNVSDG
jgi:hypothetical protein